MKADWTHLEEFRMTPPPSSVGDYFGQFKIKLGHATYACVIAYDAGHEVSEGWEHVSVHIRRYTGRGTSGEPMTPTWAQMDAIKRMFWGDDEVAVQFHIGGPEKVNIHPHVLHIWRDVAGCKLPPKIMV